MMSGEPSSEPYTANSRPVLCTSATKLVATQPIVSTHTIHYISLLSSYRSVSIRPFEPDTAYSTPLSTCPVAPLGGCKQEQSEWDLISTNSMTLYTFVVTCRYRSSMKFPPACALAWQRTSSATCSIISFHSCYITTNKNRVPAPYLEAATILATVTSSVVRGMFGGLTCLTTLLKWWFTAPNMTLLDRPQASSNKSKRARKF